MRYLTLLTLLIACSACTIEQDPPKPGPDGSWWLGGLDGGAYVKITDDQNKDDRIFQGTIYFDSDKSVWYTGPLELVGANSFDPENRGLYEAWDGERLHLKGGAYLKAMQPIPPL